MHLSHFVTDKIVYCHAKLICQDLCPFGGHLGIRSGGLSTPHDATMLITAGAIELSFLLSWSEK